jgi:hypothetical protein
MTCPNLIELSVEATPNTETGRGARTVATLRTPNTSSSEIT